MKFYYYCSYDGSPVGFQFGSISGNADNEPTTLLTGTIPLFLRQCFECGEVHGAWGFLPGTQDQYFLLRKNIQATREDEDRKRTRIYYMNIAIVYDASEYECLTQKVCPEEELARAVLDSIQIAPKDPLGLQVIPNRLENIAMRLSEFLCATRENWNFYDPKAQPETVFISPKDSEILKSELLSRLGFKGDPAQVRSLTEVQEKVRKSQKINAPRTGTRSNTRPMTRAGSRSRLLFIPAILGGVALICLLAYLLIQPEQPEQPEPTAPQLGIEISACASETTGTSETFTESLSETLPDALSKTNETFTETLNTTPGASLTGATSAPITQGFAGTTSYPSYTSYPYIPPVQPEQDLPVSMGNEPPDITEIMGAKPLEQVQTQGKPTPRSLTRELERGRSMKLGLAGQSGQNSK